MQTVGGARKAAGLPRTLSGDAEGLGAGDGRVQALACQEPGLTRQPGLTCCGTNLCRAVAVSCVAAFRVVTPASNVGGAKPVPCCAFTTYGPGWACCCLGLTRVWSQWHANCSNGHASLTGRDQAALGRLRSPMGFLHLGRRSALLATHAASAEHSARELASKQVWSGPSYRRMLLSSPYLQILDWLHRARIAAYTQDLSISPRAGAASCRHGPHRSSFYSCRQF